MASASGVNFVRYFFYIGNGIAKPRKQSLVALAYATARDLQLAPKEILIRSDLHVSTMINGKRVKDPLGWHGTFSFKDSSQVEREFHVTSHGYTNGREDFVLNDVTHSPEKEDSTLRGVNKVVWPRKEDLEEYEDSPVAYSHMS